MRISITIIVLGTSMVAIFLACSGEKADQAMLDTSSVTKLLDLLDTIAAKNPNFQEVEAQLATLPVPSQRIMLDSLAQRNREDRSIGRGIDDLLAGPGYKLYYTQYANVTPKIHREILCHLPYEAINSPADISRVLMELFRHRQQVRVWATALVPQIDMAQARQIAEGWLPAGSYQLPPTRIFYDGNGDAFAQPSGIGLDLYGVLLAAVPEAERFGDLSRINILRMNETVAHELHYMYSRSALKQAPMESPRQATAVAALSREIVSEGLATQCNPLTGLDKEITEDPLVIAYWIADLKSHAATFDKLPGDSPWKRLWRDSTYQELATFQRTAFLSRCYPGQSIDSISRVLPVICPDLAHTLGRWMVRHISRDGGDRNQAIALLQHPDSVYVWYDRSAKQLPAELRFEWE